MSKESLDYEKKRITSVCIVLHCTVFVAAVAKKLHTKRTHKDLVCCDEISMAFHSGGVSSCNLTDVTYLLNG